MPTINDAEPDSVGSYLLSGAEAISREIGLPIKKTFYHLGRGNLPAKKRWGLGLDRGARCGSTLARPNLRWRARGGRRERAALNEKARRRWRAATVRLPTQSKTPSGNQSARSAEGAKCHLSPRLAEVRSRLP